MRPKYQLHDLLSHVAIENSESDPVLKEWERAVVFDCSEMLEALVPEGKLPEPIALGEFGGCAPPVSSGPFFVESTLDRSGGLARLGSLCFVADWDDPGVSNIREMYKEHVLPNFESKEEVPCRWVVRIVTMIQVFGDHEWSRFHGSPNITTVADGSLLFVGDGYVYVTIDELGRAVGSISYTPEDATSGMKTLLGLGSFQVLHTMAFLNAKTQCDLLTPNHQSRKALARAVGNRHGSLPAQEFYMLRVDHNGPSGSVRPLREPTDRKKRRHFVRGHFRRVGPTGMFGRGDHAGELVYIRNHERGESSLGRVDKGYELRP